MPIETIKIPFSKKSAYAAFAVLLVFILLLLKTAIGNYLVGDITGTVIFGIFIALITGILVLMIITRLIPALKGEVAMALDSEGIKDYIRGIVLDWKDVEDIGLKRGRSSAMMIFEMKAETDFGKQIFISLRWVEGKDSEIYKTVLTYFDEAEGIVRENGDEDESDDESNF